MNFSANVFACLNVDSDDETTVRIKESPKEIKKVQEVDNNKDDQKPKEEKRSKKWKKMSLLDNTVDAKGKQEPVLKERNNANDNGKPRDLKNKTQGQDREYAGDKKYQNRDSSRQGQNGYQRQRYDSNNRQRGYSNNRDQDGTEKRLNGDRADNAYAKRQYSRNRNTTGEYDNRRGNDSNNNRNYSRNRDNYVRRDHDGNVDQRYQDRNNRNYGQDDRRNYSRNRNSSRAKNEDYYVQRSENDKKEPVTKREDKKEPEPVKKDDNVKLEVLEGVEIDADLFAEEDIDFDEAEKPKKVDAEESPKKTKKKKGKDVKVEEVTENAGEDERANYITLSTFLQGSDMDLKLNLVYQDQIMETPVLEEEIKGFKTHHVERYQEHAKYNKNASSRIG